MAKRILVLGTEIIRAVSCGGKPDSSSSPGIWDHRLSMADPKIPASDESPHDVLAAEEFGVPAPDPVLHREEAHDILAAEEFGVPASDPVLHHGPVRLPDDPSGIVEAHDVLAAEEFALPAPRPGASGPGTSSPGASRGAWVGAAALALLALRRRRRRRSRRSR
jgi:hypothetical protein